MTKAMKQALKTKTLTVHSIGIEHLREAIRLGFVVVIAK